MTSPCITVRTLRRPLTLGVIARGSTVEKRLLPFVLQVTPSLEAPCVCIFVSSWTPAWPARRCFSSLSRRTLIESKRFPNPNNYSSIMATIFANSSELEPLPACSCGVAHFPSEITPFLARDMMRSPLAKSPA